MITNNMQPKVAMLPLSEAQERLLAVIRSRMQLTATTVSIFSALDRTLAADVFSPIAVPTATNSAMDGYALRLLMMVLSTQQRWPIVGQSLAGHPFEGEIPTGACIRITTGAVVPADLDTVVMQEDTHSRLSSIPHRWSLNDGRLPGNITVYAPVN
ncbi:MAG: hypothetical protein U5L02_08860 [Rheinheimera sp.]|nr:hypothetical protein [Rheinheimera sp.]